MKIGTPVKVRVGKHPVVKGVIAGKPERQSNGEFVPVNITPKDAPRGTPKDIRKYRAAYLTAMGAK